MHSKMHSNNSVSCSKIYNVTGNTYDVKSPDGGIPENLYINFITWLIIVVAFHVIRWAWKNSRLSLVPKNDKSCFEIFFGKTTDESIDGSIETGEDDVSDKGFFYWIIAVFKLSDDVVRRRAGYDAIRYLDFQKFLISYTVIICVLSIVVILPVNYSGDNAEKNHYSATTLANLSSDSNVIWLHTIFAFLYLAILVGMAWKFCQRFETDSDPMSQLTVLISHVAKSASKDQIKQHFDEIYSEGSVNNVQFAYNISKLTVINRKVTAANHSLDTYANGKTQDTKVSTNMICPCFPCYKETHNGLEYFTKEEQRYTNDFRREKDAVSRYKTLGIAFVTFIEPNLASRCIQDYRIFCGNRKASSVSTAIKSNKWTVERAPSPSNIIWENLSADPKYWWLRTGLINICLFLFVLFFTTPAVLLTGWNRLQSSVEDKIESPKDPVWSQFLPTLVLWLVSAVLPSLVSKSSYYEYQWTRTQQEKSVMIKVYIFLLCMIVILPSLALTSLDALFEITVRGDFQSVSDRMKCIFLPNSGAFFVNYVITSALIGTALELMRLPELFVYLIRICYTKDEGERLLVKKEAVVEFPFGIQYAWMIATYSIIINYSIACPIVVPCGLLYLLLKHFVDRYNLLFNHRPPAYEYMGRSVHNTAFYFLICSTFLLPFCISFYSIIRLGIEYPRTIFALVVLLITLTIFTIKMCGWCCGWFARHIPYQRLSSSDEQEENRTDSQTPDEYLPLVLKLSYHVGETPEDDHATSSRRRHYGTNDHVDNVIDSDNGTIFF